MKFICTKCGHEEDTSTRQPRCSCGGLWRLEFTPPPFTLDGVDKDTWSMFRYRKFMALDGDDWRGITLGEGMTPIIPFNNDVWLKMDYFMPTLSFKDRGAAVLISHAKAIGVDKVVQDSSGNAGNSVAAYCARAGIACDIYVPEGTSDKKITMIKAHGATVHVIPGSRDHCAEVCRETARREGVYYANHVYNPFFYEGTKTYIYETFEQMHRVPEHIFVPVGNGTLFLGIIKGLEHLLQSGVISHMPQLYMVQSERCQPLLTALEHGAGHITPGNVEPTLAEGIAIGKPMRHEEILSYAAKYHVKGVAIPEEDILPARAYLAKQGIYCEHTTAAVFAGYEAYCRKYGQLHDVLISMCGAGLKSDHG